MALEVESDALRETVSFPLVDKCSSPTWCSPPPTLRSRRSFFSMEFQRVQGGHRVLEPCLSISVHHSVLHMQHTCTLSCTCSVHAYCLAHAAYMHIVLHMQRTCTLSCTCSIHAHCLAHEEYMPDTPDRHAHALWHGCYDSKHLCACCLPFPTLLPQYLP